MEESNALSFFKEIMNGGNISDGVYDILVTTPQEFAGGAPWAFVENIYNSAILPLSLGIIVIYFMIALIEKLSSEHFNWDQMVKTFAVFVGSWYLIQNAFPIMEGLFNIGASILEAFNGNVNAPVIDEATQKALWKDLTGKDNLEDVGTMKSMWLTIKLAPYWICSWVLNWSARIICYTRLIEIFIRTMFAPIALSDCFHRGLDGAGARFLKNYLAVSLQGAVIYAVITIYAALCGSVLASADHTFSGFIGISLVLGFAAVGVLFKSMNFTKELVGTA